MSDVETIVRMFHESWDRRDPDRGAAVIAEDCQFEDVARGELQVGPEGYRRDYERWRAAFPDGEVKVTNVIVQGDWAVVEFVNRGTQTGILQSSLGAFPPVAGRWKSGIAVSCGCGMARWSRDAITTIPPGLRASLVWLIKA